MAAAAAWTAGVPATHLQRSSLRLQLQRKAPLLPLLLLLLLLLLRLLLLLLLLLSPSVE